MVNTFDVMIIGGGMAGATLACALQKCHLHIALVDEKGEHAKCDHRLIALNASGSYLFQHLGLWNNMIADAAAIQEVHVSKRGYFGSTRLTASEAGCKALGYVLPAACINKALLADLEEKKAVHCISPAKLIGLTLSTPEEPMATVLLDIHSTVQTYQTRLVIGADGSDSMVRQLLNIPIKKVNYQQTALVSVIKLARDHQHIAYERFQSKGAIALLPLVGKRAAVIWTAPNDEIGYLCGLDAVGFLQILQKKFGYWLGRLQDVEERYTYPVYMQQASTRIYKNSLLIGNAAHTLHPIAAQGFNLALHEIAMLAEYLTKIKTPDNLLRFFCDFPRKQRQQKFSRYLSNGLVDLFCKDFCLVNLARQSSMIAFDFFSLAKKHFTDYAMGRSGDIPPLFLPPE